MQLAATWLGLCTQLPRVYVADLRHAPLLVDHEVVLRSGTRAPRVTVVTVASGVRTRPLGGVAAAEVPCRR